MDTLATTPKEAFAAIGVGNTKGWELISSGQLEVFKIGRATRVTTASVRRFVERRLAETREIA